MNHENEKFSNYRGMKKIDVFEIHVNEGAGEVGDPMYREIYYVKADGTIIGHETGRGLRKFADDKPN